MNHTDSARDISPQRPWLGLRSYTGAAQAYFYGRDAQIRELYQRVSLNPLTVLYGRSGLGKTSLLQAGLLPRLKVEGRAAVLIRLNIEDDAPRLIRQVRDALGACIGVPAADASLWELARYEATRPAIELARPVLVFDQFEELFTLAQRNAQRDRRDELAEFMAELANLVENRPPATLAAREPDGAPAGAAYSGGETAVRIVLALREDYLHELERWKKTLPSLMRNRMELVELDGPSALQAVTGPGSKSGTPLVDDPVARSIVCFVAKRDPGTDLADIEAVPPLLSLMCAELNGARLQDAQSTITSERVSEQSGDILKRFYDRCFDAMPAAVREVVEDLLIDNSGRYRESSSRETVVGELTENHVADAEAVLDALIARRLLSADVRDGVQRIEFTHDLLVPLAAQSRALTDQRKAAEKQRQAVETRRQQRLSQRRLWTIVAMGFLLVLALAGGSAAFVNGRAADAAHRAAESARKVVVQNLEQAARRAWGRSQEQLARDAYPRYYAYLAESLGYQPLPRAREAAFIALQTMSGRVGSVDIAFDTAPLGATFNADASILLTTHANGRAQFRRIDDAAGTATREAILPAIGAATFSDDGRTLAVADDAGRVHFFGNDSALPTSVATGVQPQTLLLSPDGAWLLSHAFGDDAQLWNLRSAQQETYPLPGTAREVGFQFSADSGVLMSIGMTGGLPTPAGPISAVRTWDLRARPLAPQPVLAAADVQAAVLTRDAKRVLASGRDGLAHLYDLHTGASRVAVPIGANPASLGFTPDETRIVLEETGGRVTLWDIATGKRIDQAGVPVTAGTPRPARRASVATHAVHPATSPDGLMFASIEDGRLLLRSTADGRLMGIFETDSDARHARFDRSGTHLLAIGHGSTGKLFQVAGNSPECELTRHDRAVDAARETGGALVTQAGAAVQVRDLKSGALVAGHSSAVLDDPTPLQVGTRAPRTFAAVMNSANADLYGSARFALAASNADASLFAVVDSTRSVVLADRPGGPSAYPALIAEPNIMDIRLSRSGDRLVLLRSSHINHGAIESWDISDRAKPRRTLNAELTKVPASDADGTLIATHDGKRIDFWDTKTGLLHNGMSITPAFPVSQLQMSADARFLLVVTEADSQLWRLQPPAAEKVFETGNFSRVASVRFSEDAALVAIASGEGRVTVFRTASPTPDTAVLDTGNVVGAMAFSPDNARLAVATAGSIQLWSVKSSERLGVPLQPVARTNALAFSSDGHRLIVAGNDGGAYVCHVRADTAAGSDELARALNAIGGTTIGDDGRVEPSTREHDAAFAQPVDGRLSLFERVVRWHYTRGAQRTLSPFSTTTRRARVDAEIDWVLERRGDAQIPAAELELALYSAYFLEPEHPLILLALSLYEERDTTREILYTKTLERLRADASQAERAVRIFRDIGRPDYADKVLQLSLRARGSDIEPSARNATPAAGASAPAAPPAAADR